MPISRILVVRNDKLGDFMLAWPAFALLKRSLPNAEVHALVPDYTRPLAELCPWIDRVIVDTGPSKGWRTLASMLRRQRYDGMVTLFSTTRVAVAGLAAGIPHRFAPATKLAQLLYNRRVTQHRSRSEKPEWRYNVELAEQFLAEFQIPAQEASPPFLRFDPTQTSELRRDFCVRYGISPSDRLVFIHSGSGGSASNLSLKQYAHLASLLRGSHSFTLVLSAGPDEAEQAERLKSIIHNLPSTVYVSEEGLDSFARHLAFADLFISGSTGPLHIAGALNRPTAAFYPRRRSATSLRWQTLNTEERRLAFSPASDSDDMETVDLEAAAKEISRRFLV